MQRKSLLTEGRGENGSAMDRASEMKSHFRCLRNRKTFNCDWKVLAAVFAPSATTRAAGVEQPLRVEQSQHSEVVPGLMLSIVSSRSFP